MTKAMADEVMAMDCPQADEKSTLSDRNIPDPDTPIMDDSKGMLTEECQQGEKQITDKGM